VIITAGRLGEQLCWSEPWTEFSARTVLRVLAVTGLDTVVPVIPSWMMRLLRHPVAALARGSRRRVSVTAVERVHECC